MVGHLVFRPFANQAGFQTIGQLISWMDHFIQNKTGIDQFQDCCKTGCDGFYGYCGYNCCCYYGYCGYFVYFNEINERINVKLV
jgi:hypothetical protein